jgi:hypothetical protein
MWSAVQQVQKRAEAEAAALAAAVGTVHTCIDASLHVCAASVPHIAVDLQAGEGTAGGYMVK